MDWGGVFIWFYNFDVSCLFLLVCDWSKQQRFPYLIFPPKANIGCDLCYRIIGIQSRELNIMKWG